MLFKKIANGTIKKAPKWNFLFSGVTIKEIAPKI
jgi:hypothetical protein